jgi:hypothetical protein
MLRGVSGKSLHSPWFHSSFPAAQGRIGQSRDSVSMFCIAPE